MKSWVENNVVSEQSVSLVIRVGRKNTIVIPKRVAERLSIGEGDRLLLVVRDDRIEIRPLPNAITLSLKGIKVARVTQEELEEESMRVQEEYIEKA